MLFLRKYCEMWVRKCKEFLVRDHSKCAICCFVSSQLCQSVMGCAGGIVLWFSSEFATALFWWGICDLVFTETISELAYDSAAKRHDTHLALVFAAWACTAILSPAAVLHLYSKIRASPIEQFLWRMYMWGFLVRWTSTVLCLDNILMS